MAMNSRRRLFLCIALAATAVVYRQVIWTYFFADDFGHMLEVINVSTARFLFAPFAGHLYLVRNLVLMAMFHLFGTWTTPYFAIVLGTHLLNVWLLFRVIRCLSGSDLLACFGATLWGTTPAHVGTLGWYSVYGQVLSATVTLVVLDQLARRVEHDEPLTPRSAVGWAVLLLLG